MSLAWRGGGRRSFIAGQRRERRRGKWAVVPGAGCRTYLTEKGKAHGEPGRLALPVAGDSAEGKQLVMRLVEDTGFDAVDAGPIAESWRQQFGTSAYATELTADQLREALRLADREAAPKRRDAIVQIVSTWQGPVATQDWPPLFRAAPRFPAADD